MDVDEVSERYWDGEYPLGTQVGQLEPIVSLQVGHLEAADFAAQVEASVFIEMSESDLLISSGLTSTLGITGSGLLFNFFLNRALSISFLCVTQWNPPASSPFDNLEDFQDLVVAPF